MCRKIRENLAKYLVFEMNLTRPKIESSEGYYFFFFSIPAASGLRSQN